MKSFYRFSYKAVLWLSAFIALLLSVCSLFFTSYSYDMLSQQVSLRQDNLLLTLLKSLPFIALGYFLSSHIAKDNSARRLRLLELFVMGVYFCAGCFLILFGRTVPAADAMSVFAGGVSVASGDFSVFVGADSYYSYYPFQVGLSMFEALFIRLWNLFPILNAKPAYHFIKLMYVLLIVLSVHIIRKITELLWHSETTTCICLVLLLFQFPLIMYSSFVYGEIPGLVFFLGGFYYALRVVHQVGSRFRLYFLLSVLLCGFSVLVRKNSLILIIAVCISLLYEFFRTKRKSILCLAFSILACAVTFPALAQSYAEYRSGYELKQGVTGLSYIAMGMQESTRSAGWYNGFNFLTYLEADQDTSAANQVARRAIAERLDVFRADPSYALDFYWRKFTSLWCDGTYACRQATLAFLGQRPEFLNQIYGGRYQSVVVDWCDLYQNFLHIGLFLFVLDSLLSKTPKRNYCILEMTFVIAMIGGFLFHLVWEANSRYIFTYGILLIPIAARGLTAGIPGFKRKGA